MKIGVIKETKIPEDSRVPLSPSQAADLIKNHQIDLVVQSSGVRIFSDDEYRDVGVPVVDSVEDRDILLGVKEVKTDALIGNKTYFFFSHTIKEQPYNRGLLRSILEKSIRLIDYEVLTDERGQRLIAFGRFAGMVGAHNGIMAYGIRTKFFQLPRLKDLRDYAEAKDVYRETSFPPMRVVLSGGGRVASGSVEVLTDMGFEKVDPYEYLDNKYDHPVFCQLEPRHYAKRKDGEHFEKRDFYTNPLRYESAFAPWMKCSDIFINGIYWDNDAPAFFSLEEMRGENFSIQVIADVTCDIAPVSSVPSTIRPSTIAEPVYGFDPQKKREILPYSSRAVDIMAVDNLPNELPRDASESFGAQFIENILPELRKDASEVLERATIAENGKLGPHFTYLKDYAGIG
jgi:saccharopine dehydrogenase (NAD+, L-lysine forming)